MQYLSLFSLIITHQNYVKNNMSAQNQSVQMQSVKPMAGPSECAVPVSSNNQGYSSFGKLYAC